MTGRTAAAHAVAIGPSWDGGVPILFVVYVEAVTVALAIAIIVLSSYLSFNIGRSKGARRKNVVSDHAESEIPLCESYIAQKAWEAINYASTNSAKTVKSSICKHLGLIQTRKVPGADRLAVLAILSDAESMLWSYPEEAKRKNAKARLLDEIERISTPDETSSSRIKRIAGPIVRLKKVIQDLELDGTVTGHLNGERNTSCTTISGVLERTLTLDPDSTGQASRADTLGPTRKSSPTSGMRLDSEDYFSCQSGLVESDAQKQELKGRAVQVTTTDLDAIYSCYQTTQVAQKDDAEQERSRIESTWI